MNRINTQRFKRSHATFIVILTMLTGVGLLIYGLSTSLFSVERSGSSEAIKFTPGSSNVKPSDLTNRYKIVIDPGHGGKDPGAEGASGKLEKEYTLSLSTKVFNLLQQEPLFEAYMTRTDDTFVKLEDRAYMSNQLEADAFISIHANTYTDPAISGTETYYYNDESLLFAHEIHKQLLKAAGFKDRGVKHEGWMVLKKSNRLAILMEVGYFTNLSNETDMLSERHQDRVAQGIVQGIKTYFAQN